MKKDRTKELLLEQLRKIPIISVGCEKSGISRTSVYKWKQQDKQFCKALNEALAEGEANMTDLSELQLFSLMRDKHFPAIHLYLRHHHPKYSNKIEVTGSLTIEQEPLTAEQQELVGRALKLAGLTDSGELIPNHEKISGKN